MLQNLSVAWSMATFPVRLLSRGYHGLAWAFDAPPRPAPGQELAPDTLPQGARDRLLKLGFVSSTLLWAPLGYFVSVAHQLGWISQAGAWTGFVWGALALWVASLAAVRRSGRSKAAARAASPIARARRAVTTVVRSPATIAANLRAVANGAASRGRTLVSKFGRATFARAGFARADAPAPPACAVPASSTADRP